MGIYGNYFKPQSSTSFEDIINIFESANEDLKNTDRLFNYLSLGESSFITEADAKGTLNNIKESILGALKKIKEAVKKFFTETLPDLFRKIKEKITGKVAEVKDVEADEEFEIEYKKPDQLKYDMDKISDFLKYVKEQGDKIYASKDPNEIFDIYEDTKEEATKFSKINKEDNDFDTVTVLTIEKGASIKSVLEKVEKALDEIEKDIKPSTTTFLKDINDSVKAIEGAAEIRSGLANNGMKYMEDWEKVHAISIRTLKSLVTLTNMISEKAISAIDTYISKNIKAYNTLASKLKIKPKEDENENKEEEA